MAFLSIRLHVLKDGKEIFFHRQFSKDGRFLRQISNPRERPFIHGQVRHLKLIQMDRAPIWMFQTDDHIKGCCLAGAIFTEQANNAPLGHFEADMVNNDASPIFLYQIICTNFHRFFLL